MTSEDQDILAKISQLAGKINRHKNQQQPTSFTSNQKTEAGLQSHPNFPQTNIGWRTSRGAYAGRGRGYSRGGRMNRNKTLVLNGGSTASPSESTHSNTANEISDTPSTNVASSSGWVTKTDRHLQLINPAIYEKQSQQRAKAMEETRKLRLKQRDERERLKFSKHLQRLEDSSGMSGTIPTTGVSNHEISVHGIRFRVVKNGGKLMKVPGKNSTRKPGIRSSLHSSGSGLRDPGDENAAKATPKTATVGGVMFYRSKNGNLYRSGIVKAQRRRGVIKKINEPCKAFSTTGSLSPKRYPETISRKDEGPKCRYIHDPSKVAICKDFLQKGTCPAGEACDLSHDLTSERTPACLHFAKGNCSNQNCRYTHVRVSPTALVCRPFGIYGYCEKGVNCPDRHVHECPDFSNTGTCSTKGCKLLHRHKASIIRKNTARGEQPDEAGSSDISSDEDEDEIDSDDVDSVDLDEEYFGQEGEKDPDIPMQLDFVQLK